MEKSFCSIWHFVIITKICYFKLFGKGNVIPYIFWEVGEKFSKIIECQFLRLLPFMCSVVLQIFLFFLSKLYLVTPRECHLWYSIIKATKMELALHMSDTGRFFCSHESVKMFTFFLLTFLSVKLFHLFRLVARLNRSCINPLNASVVALI